MSKEPFIVAVSANSGGGKTTVTKELSKKLPKAGTVFFDDYEYHTQPDNIGKWIEEGSPTEAWDLSLFMDELKRLIDTKSYDYIILDYPFGRKDYPVKPYIDMTVFIDTPLDIALARRLIRDFEGAAGEDIINELQIYLSWSRKFYADHTYDLSFSDLIVDGTLELEEKTDLIIREITARNK